MKISYVRVVLVFAMLLALTPAHAAKRIALLIGNQDYKRQVGPLANPINDVNLIAASLRKIGFANSDILVVKNGTRRQVLRAVERHTRRLAQAGDGAVGFLYYSGHGIANQETKRNYLIPVDVERLDADVWFDAVPLDEIVSNLSKRAPTAANFVIFDACRNVLNTPTKGGKGFVPVQARRGMLIAFSTDPGQTASDEGRGSGPYAKALARELARPGQHHLDLFQNVKEQVFRTTKVQVPWERNGLLERVYLAGRQTPSPPPVQSPAAIAWQKLKATQDEAALRAFADKYKGTVFSELATSRIALNRLHQQSLDAVRETSKPKNPFKLRNGLADLVPAPKRPTTPASNSDTAIGCFGESVELSSGKHVCIMPGSGQSFKDCDVCPEMVVVPAGSFVMGSKKSDVVDAKPVRKVTIGASLAVGKFEVTFAEWDACVSEGGCKQKPGDQAWGRGTWPVINVSWNDITKQYLPWLSRKSGQSYRLLTEAEWEYVARAGTTGRWSFEGDESRTCDFANHADTSTSFDWKNKKCSDGVGERTAEVGRYKPNPWGLHDVYGNVWEWVQDCYKDSYSGAPTDGSAVTTGKCSGRVFRGGSWRSDPQSLRSSNRGVSSPGLRRNFMGFRVVRVLTP